MGIEAVEVGDELGDSLGESAGEALGSVLCAGVVVGVGAGSGAHADSRPRASAAPAITVRERWRVDIDDSWDETGHRWNPAGTRHPRDSAPPEAAGESSCRDRYRRRVTRIISGRAGSLGLAVPDAGTRPTSDRVRESLFGALDAADLLRGARVLDLYAGSGALGLEAASRGAATVDLVEKSPQAVTVIRRNVSRVQTALRGSPDAARLAVHRAGVEAYLRSAPVGVFDLVFLDPPYDLPDAELRTVLDLLVPALSPRATVIVERGARSASPVWPTALRADRHRRYGDTALWWAVRDGGQPDAESQSR